jgi:hypothetical protein
VGQTPPRGGKPSVVGQQGAAPWRGAVVCRGRGVGRLRCSACRAAGRGAGPAAVRLPAGPMRSVAGATYLLGHGEALLEVGAGAEGGGAQAAHDDAPGRMFIGAGMCVCVVGGGEGGKECGGGEGLWAP